jgi:uncharacterized protein (DUF58 family)
MSNAKCSIVVIVKIRDLLQFVSPKDIRNGILGLSVTIGGLGLAFLTLFAHRTGNAELAGIAAGSSLIFVLLIMIFVIPPLARNASKEASQLNLPFEVTVGGAVFLGLLTIVAFAAWNTGNNLLFLVLSFLISAFVVSFFIGHLCLNKLDVKMRFPETIFADEPTPILVSLNNRKFLFPTVSVVAEVRGQEKEKSFLVEEVKKILPERWAKRLMRPPIVKYILDYFIYVPRRKTVENKTEHTFTKRGRFFIKDFELSTKFPFGFFRHRRRLSAQEVELIIFPKIENIETEINDLPLEVGKLLTNKRGAGQDLLSLREYQPTDDFRRINWKATARTQRLTVSEFSAEDEKRVTIFFDTNLAFDKELRNKTLRQRIEEEQMQGELSETSKRFESGIIKTASLLSHFTDENTEIRLIINDEKGNFGTGKIHLFENLRKLANLEPKFNEVESDGKTEKNLAEVYSRSENSRTFSVIAEETNFSSEIIGKDSVLRF